MLRIGTLTLESNLMLAPLAGYTNLPFRLVVRRLGGLGLATTDLVNARSLIEHKSKAFKLIETRADDRPLTIQLFGSVATEMAEAARVAEGLGAAAVDVNMGCPVRKVCAVGGGSAMMNDLTGTLHLVERMVRAVKIPVTAKMRLGWDDQHLTAPDLARGLTSVGVAAITVHGRTRAQGFQGPVNLAGIRAVVAAVPGIPVIGNGDVITPETAAQMLESTGCHGISIGRGAFYNPWIFLQTQHWLTTGQRLPEPGFEDRINLMRQHLALMVEVFGESQGCQMFRKVAPQYARRFGPAREFNRRVVHLSRQEDFETILADYRQWRQQFLDESGQLKAGYEPAPLKASFLGVAPHRELPPQTPAQGSREYW